MRNLLAQVGQFFEAHVEKMVLGLVGVLGLYLLVTQVMLGPNRVSYKNKSYSAGQIDPIILREAKRVEADFTSAPLPKAAPRSPLHGPLDMNDTVKAGIRAPLKGGFQELFGSSISHIGSEGTLSVPMHTSTGPIVSTGAHKDRAYRLPDVGAIEDVKVDHIRAAAYIPISPVTPEEGYQESSCEINDLDLVTVEGTFDLVRLYERFHESFTGDEVQAAWRDASLAEPVIVAVQLQRQQSLGDSQWGEWQDVPRSRVEARRDLLKVSESGSGQGAGGVQVRRIQFKNNDVLSEVLQPAAYQIASTYEEWLPPTLHREYLEQWAKQKKEEQRQAREEERASQEGARSDRRRTADTTPGVDGGRGDGAGRGRRDATTGRAGTGAGDQRTGRAGSRTGRLDQRTNDAAGYGDRTRTARGPAGRAEGYPGEPGIGAPGMESQSALMQVYLKFDQLRVTPMTDLTKLKKLVLWAHDDTIEPGRQYRYRLRLGVLNPIAGTDQVSAADQARRNQMILWSSFSEETPAVDIPARQYFFAKDFREGSGEVGVEVCKFILGYWRSQDFSVRPGETIGRTMEVKSKNPRTNPLLNPGMGDYAMQTPEDQIFQPAEVDYGTGVVLVAVSRVEGWTVDTRARSQTYYDMLYSPDGLAIERTAIGTPNWSKEQSVTYATLKKLLGTEIEPPRSWNQGMDRGMGMGRGLGNEYGGRGGRMPVEGGRMMDRGQTRTPR